MIVQVQPWFSSHYYNKEPKCFALLCTICLGRVFYFFLSEKGFKGEIAQKCKSLHRFKCHCMYLIVHLYLSLCDVCNHSECFWVLILLSSISFKWLWTCLENPNCLALSRLPLFNSAGSTYSAYTGKGEQGGPAKLKCRFVTWFEWNEEVCLVLCS